MKKHYMKPESFQFSIDKGCYLLADSIESGRFVDGDPTNTGDGVNIPGVVGETDENTDPYGGHGQGSGGNGNRSKYGNLWDDFEDEEW